ncbi:MAG: tetratricopeptide repeat protein [Elusimicrobiota bacterium]|jgi:tetratricopeptide (TPR) repeat protein|nr:tetratricopeptide repeat protein [Elusimicrobiota bacterium]
MKKNIFLSGVMMGILVCLPIMIIVGYLFFEQLQPSPQETSAQTPPQNRQYINPSGYPQYLNEPKTPQDMLKFLDKIIDLQPRNAQAYLAKAGLLSELGDWRQALKNYDIAVSLDPADAQGYMGRAGAKFMLGDFAGAEKDFSAAIRLNPQLAQAYYNRGVANVNLARLLLAEKDFAKAQDLFLQSKDNASYNDAVRAAKLVRDYRLASAAQAKRNNNAHASADKNKISKELSSMKPAAKSAQKEVSEIFAGLKTKEKGLLESFDWSAPKNNGGTQSLPDLSKDAKILRKFLDEQKKENKPKQPREKTAADYRSDARKKDAAKDFKGALEDLNAAISLSPKSAGLYMDRASMHARQNEAQSALKDLEEVIKINPENAEAHLLKAEMESLLGKRDIALESAKKAKELFDAQGNQDGRARAQNEINRQIGKAREAMKDDNKFEKMFTKASKAYADGNYREAYNVFKQIYDENPTPGNAYNSALAAMKLNNLNESLKYLAEAKKGKIPDAFSSAATILAQQGKYDEAQKNIKEGIEICPACPNLYTSDAINKSARGRAADAIESFGKAIELSGEKPNAVDYLGRAQEYLNINDFSENFKNVNNENIGGYIKNIAKSLEDLSQAIELYKKEGNSKAVQETTERKQQIEELYQLFQEAQRGGGQ